MYFRSFAGKVMSFVNFTCPSVTGCPAGLSTFPCTVAFCAIAGAAAPIATTAVAVSKISLQVLIRFLPSCESSRLHPLSTLVWTRETGPCHHPPLLRRGGLRAARPTYMDRCPWFNFAQLCTSFSAARFNDPPAPKRSPRRSHLPSSQEPPRPRPTPLEPPARPPDAPVAAQKTLRESDCSRSLPAGMQ